MQKELGIILSLLIALPLVGCRERPRAMAVSNSGVKKVSVKVKKNSQGHSVEQENIIKRLDMDNQPGSIKHLYLVNNDGECILYSTVKGKVTSSGKRLTPYRVVAGGSRAQYGSRVSGFGVNFGGRTFETNEVLQDDGTYGSSEKYIYWWSHTGQYYQYIKSMSLSVIISDKPVRTLKPKLILASQGEHEE